MTYSKAAIEDLDPLVRTLMEALGWDWPGTGGVPSADECLTDVAVAIRELFMTDEAVHAAMEAQRTFWNPDGRSAMRAALRAASGIPADVEVGRQNNG